MSDCLNRRDFLKRGTVAVVGASMARAAVLAGTPAFPKPDSETLASEFYKSLTAAQKKVMAFPFEHPLRQRVENNWRITRATVTSLTGEQQAMVFDIVRGLHSPEYVDAVMAQIEHDNGGADNFGFGRCAVAVFGEPGTGRFEFVFTGRHVTRRCDGDSVAGAAFGGPIFYGHAAESFYEKPDHPGNIYWFQAKRANEVFKALDGKQQKLALRSDPRRERGTKTVEVSGKKTGLAGIRVGDLQKDQQQLVHKVMADLLAPFREQDVKECMKLVEAGGFDNLHMAFYKNLDVGDDKVWDVWQLEGPAMVWYFRGHPHVHTWVNIRRPRPWVL
jgi:Protein of unknown function (DUF3500)